MPLRLTAAALTDDGHSSRAAAASSLFEMEKPSKTWRHKQEGLDRDHVA